MEALASSASTAPRSSRPRGQLLTDVVSVRFQLVEDQATGKIVVRGEFARADTATENKRVYPQKLWEREINKLSKPMTDRKLMGELDHPNDGRTMLSRVSHLVTGMRLENGVIIGEAEVIETDAGRNLAALFKANARVGVSSRGYGSTRTVEGREIVQDDYQLVTFDFVAEPADGSAYPEVFAESKEPVMDRELQLADEQAKAEIWARKLADAKQEGVAEATMTLREQLAQELLDQIAAERDKIRTEVREEFLRDPSVAGARTTLEGVKALLLAYLLPEDAQSIVRGKDEEIAKLRRDISERELKISALQEENDKIGLLAKEAGYKYFVERALSGNPDGDLVRKLLGEMKQYESAAALRTKLEAIVADLNKKHADAKKLDESRQQEQAREREATSQIESKVVTLEHGLEASLKLNKSLGLQLYAARRLEHHPQAAKIRPLVEAANLSSEKDVDDIIDRFRVPVRDSETLEQTRSRVRSATRGGLSSTPLEEEAPLPNARNNGGDNYNGLGTDLSSLRELSGIRTNQLPAHNAGVR